MAQAQIFLREGVYIPAVIPWLFAHKGVACGMQPHDRAEYAKLHPPEIKLVVFLALMMAADIVAPPSITRIGCIGGKIWLEVEHLPADFRIARKAKRIAMAANLA